MLKEILICAVLVTMVMVNPVNAQQSPPTSDKSKQIETLVDRAAALIESRGKEALAEFRKKDTEWFTGDTYLFAYDLRVAQCCFSSARGDQHHRSERCQRQIISPRLY